MTRTAYGTLLTDLDDGVLTITLNRPEALNTIVPPMPDEFEQVVRLASNDPGLAGFQRKYGEALLALRLYREARRRLRRAMEEDPSDPTVAMLLGDCLLAENKPAAAERMK